MKPTIEEVLNYAQPLTRKFIGQFAKDEPREHQEEMVQTANLRIIKLYDTIDGEGGWKSWTWNHCRGAVLDYLKFGRGWEESKWSLQDRGPKEDVPKNETNTRDFRLPRLTKRIEAHAEEEDQAFDIDRTLGISGVFGEFDPDKIEINWELLSRMSSKDEHLHAFAKYLRGISIEDMAPVFGLSRTRVSQMIQVCVDRFDDPEMADDPWFKQMCFALGVCKHLGMPDIDQAGDKELRWAGGWRLSPVDLDSLEPHHSLREQVSQMEMKLEEQDPEKEDA